VSDERKKKEMFLGFGDHQTLLRGWSGRVKGDGWSPQDGV
jgi:hypothetical protein